LPVISHIPHSSTIIPKELQNDFLLSKDDLEQEIKYMSDLYTNEIYKPLLDISAGIVSNFSRIACDVERFEDDKLECMSKYGMGAVYTKTSDKRDLRKKDFDREFTLNLLCRPHHKAFSDLTKKSLEKYNKAIIIDCHSFSEIARWYEPDFDLNTPRPDICIGTDKYHTPKWLEELFVDFFASNGFSVEINRPFAGTIVPIEFYQKDKRVNSIMIEMNRKLYMNEENFSKKENFKRVKTSLEVPF